MPTKKLTPVQIRELTEKEIRRNKCLKISWFIRHLIDKDKDRLPSISEIAKIIEENI